MASESYCQGQILGIVKHFMIDGIRRSIKEIIHTSEKHKSEYIQASAIKEVEIFKANGSAKFLKKYL